MCYTEAINIPKGDDDMATDIAISANVLLIYAICRTVATVFFLALAILSVVLYIRFSRDGMQKEAEYIYKLKLRAESDEWAQREYVRRERKYKQKQRIRQKANIPLLFAFFVSITISAVVLLTMTVPTWLDYVKRDYVVYDGDFSVYYKAKTRWIEIAEDSTLHGELVAPNAGNYNGTVVYAARSKIALGYCAD